MPLRNDSDRTGLCSKRSGMNTCCHLANRLALLVILVGDIALDPSLRKSKHKQSQHFVQYRIMSSCKLFLLIYTFIILTVRLSASCNSVIGYQKRTLERNRRTNKKSKISRDFLNFICKSIISTLSGWQETR